MQKTIIILMSAIILLLGSVIFAQQNEAKAWNNGPTEYNAADTPWIKAGIRYMEWEPDISNAEHTVGPSLGTRFHIIDDVMYIDGEIQPYITDEWIFGDAGKVKTIVLNSYGGEVAGGYALAEIIKKNGITTVVPAGGVCMSACTMVFQAGKVRKAHSTAQFMYHAVRVGKSSMLTIYKDILEDEGQDSADETWAGWIDDTFERTITMFFEIEKHGASASLFQDYVKMDQDPDYFENGNPFGVVNWYMSAEDTMQYNVVQEIF